MARCTHDCWTSSAPKSTCKCACGGASHGGGASSTPAAGRDGLVIADRPPAGNLSDEIARRSEQTGHVSVDRDEAIKAIRSALKRRSGRAWSVTCDRGTAAGWIHITAPPKRRTATLREVGEDPETGYPVTRFDDDAYPEGGGWMTEADCEELGSLLSLGRPADPQGESIPASSEHRVEYVNRAEGRAVATFGTQYWD